jgi:hypothetical protein
MPSFWLRFQRSATRLVDQPATAIEFIPGEQSVSPPLADRQHSCCSSDRPTPSLHVTQNFDPSQIALAIDIQPRHF